jgi:hypothetical protein
LDVSLGLSLAGFGESDAERAAFGRFVVSRVGLDLEGGDLSRHVRPMEELELVATKPRDAELPSITRLIDEAAAVARVQRDEVSGRRTSGAVFAKRICLRAWAAVGGHAVELAPHLGLSPSGASRLASRPHDARAVADGATHVLVRLGRGAMIGNLAA